MSDLEFVVSLLCVISLVGVTGFIWWFLLWHLPPAEVPDEARCPGCGRWLRHKWRCPLG